MHDYLTDAELLQFIFDETLSDDDHDLCFDELLSRGFFLTDESLASIK